MLKVHIDSQVSLNIDDVMEGIANLEIGELEELADRIIDLRAARRVPIIPRGETELLKKINAGVPTQLRERYDHLSQKMLDEAITSEEHQEYLLIIDQIKVADADRIQHLIQLAEIRNSSLDTVMDELGIRKPNYA